MTVLCDETITGYSHKASDREWDQSNAKIWAQVQVKLQCEKFHVILWKLILS